MSPVYSAPSIETVAEVEENRTSTTSLTDDHDPDSISPVGIMTDLTNDAADSPQGHQLEQTSNSSSESESWLGLSSDLDPSTSPSTPRPQQQQPRQQQHSGTSEKSGSPTSTHQTIGAVQLHHSPVQGYSGRRPNSPSNRPRHTRADSSGPRPASPSAMSSVTNFTSLTTKTNGSGSSSGSGSTITQASYSKPPGAGKGAVTAHRGGHRHGYESRERAEVPHLKGQRRPDVMSFLEPDSPPVARVPVPMPMSSQHQSSTTSPPWRLTDFPFRNSMSAKSASSSAGSSFSSDVFSEPAGEFETDASSPEHSINGDSAAHFRWPERLDSQIQMSPSQQRAQPGHRSYGTPEMPRGNASLPHLPPNALQQRNPISQQGQIAHLPRAEKLPMTGYELLATKLSAGSMHIGSGPTLKPMYRRFEALNHRLLLHLQDELVELEEQLHRLDTTDTQTRRVQNCILPASRRQEAAAANELQWHKTDILGKIGFKLNQYNSVLTSFKDTQSIPSPAPEDVDSYRSYLATYKIIADAEAQFLDPEDDLVSLDRSTTDLPDSNDFADDMLTPMPRASMAFPPTPSSPMSEAGSLDSASRTQCHPVGQPQDALVASTLPLSRVFMAVAAAFLLPILTFAVIPGFIGRIAVVVLVGLGVGTALLQAGMLQKGGNGLFGSDGAQEFVLCVSAYGAVMALVAGIV